MLPTTPTSFQITVCGVAAKSIFRVATSCAYSYGLSSPLTFVSQPEMTIADPGAESGGKNAEAMVKRRARRNAPEGRGEPPVIERKTSENRAVMLRAAIKHCPFVPGNQKPRGCRRCSFLERVPRFAQRGGRQSRKSLRRATCWRLQRLQPTLQRARRARHRAGEIFRRSVGVG